MPFYKPEVDCPKLEAYFLEKAIDTNETRLCFISSIAVENQCFSRVVFVPE